MSTLNRIAEDIYEARDQIRVPGGLWFPIRMTVVVTEAGLVLVSPVPIDEALAEELSALGEVCALVAPNTFHHVHLGAAQARYPDATTWAAPGLASKRKDLPIDHVLGAESPWPEIAFYPIEGAPKVGEVALYHRPSATLIVVDLIFNIYHARNWRTWFVLKVFARALGKVSQSRLWRFWTKERAVAGRSLRALLGEPIERVVPAHGEIIDENAKGRLEHATAWMLNGAPLRLQAAETKG